MRRDYYAVLGITATARPREIRQAYRRLARQYSPDVNFWDVTARHAVRGDRRGLPGAQGSRRARDVRPLRCRSRERGAVGRPAGRRRATSRRARLRRCGGGTRPCGPACRASPPARPAGPPAGWPGAVRRLSGPRRAAGRRDGGGDVPAGVDSGLQVRVPARATRGRSVGRAATSSSARGCTSIRSSRARAMACTARCRSACGRRCGVRASGCRRRSDEAVLVVPPGTPAGSVFRLRGQGAPRLADGTPGDLYVTVRVEVPRGLDARTEELVRELERLVPGPTREDLARYRGGAS